MPDPPLLSMALNQCFLTDPEPLRLFQRVQALPKPSKLSLVLRFKLRYEPCLAAPHFLTPPFWAPRFVNVFRIIIGTTPVHFSALPNLTVSPLNVPP